MRLTFRLAFAILTICAAESIADSANAHSGREVFEKRCTGCHSLDRNKVGPPLRGVFGRRAGSVAGFSYSDAVKKTSITWEAPALDRWLADTESIIPGNDMSFRLEDGAERSAIIAYLRELAHP